MAKNRTDEPKVYQFEPNKLDATALEEIQWVYQNIGAKDLPNTGPTPGAMAMLLWAINEPDKFYNIWRQACLTKPKEESNPEEIKMRKKSNRDLTARLREIVNG